MIPRLRPRVAPEGGLLARELWPVDLRFGAGVSLGFVAHPMSLLVSPPLWPREQVCSACLLPSKGAEAGGTSAHSIPVCDSDCRLTRKGCAGSSWITP